MQTSIEITVNDLLPSSLVEQLVREHVEQLGPYGDALLHCHVTVERQRHYRQGDLYVVRVRLCLPDGDLTVGSDRPGEHAHEDLRIALRESFAAVRDRLRDHALLGARRSA